MKNIFCLIGLTLSLAGQSLFATQDNSCAAQAEAAALSLATGGNADLMAVTEAKATMESFDYGPTVQAYTVRVDEICDETCSKLQLSGSFFTVKVARLNNTCIVKRIVPMKW